MGCIKKLLFRMKRFGINCVDADAIAFIQATNITDNSIQLAVCQLVSDLKTNSLWAKFHAIYPIVGGNEIAHSYNLINPSLYKTNYPTVSWTHSSNGMILNQYGVSTGINSATILDKTNSSFGVYSRTNQTDTAMIFYFSYVQISLRRSVDTFLSDMNDFNGSGARVTTSNTDSSGFFIAQRNPALLHGHYINGVYKNGNSSLGLDLAWSGSVGINTKEAVASGREISFLTIGQSLTDAENATLYTIVQAFQTTLGRQV